MKKLPLRNKDRITGEKYEFKGEVRIWSGKYLFCAHGKRKKVCFDCKGSATCEHGRQRQFCRDCGGSAFCEHRRQRRSCRECNGSAFCEHGRRRSVCKPCNGGSICEHGRERRFCKDCGGPAFCEHRRLRSTCKPCNGSQICEHGRRRQLCSDCGGSALCEHRRVRSRCYICSPDSRYVCRHCKHSQVNNKYDGLCFACFCVLHPDLEIPRRFMMKENYIHDYLRAEFPDLNLIHNKPVVCGESKRRPDWLIDVFTHCIIIECDEDKHIGYECENKRMMELFKDLGSRSVVFIRFNPDKFQGDSCFAFDNASKISTTRAWETRKLVLKDTIKKHLDSKPLKELTVECLFY